MIQNPRHTKIIESIITKYGVLIREDYHGHPKDEPNLYLANSDGGIIWLAERPLPSDFYVNPVELTFSDSIRCFSAKGIECEIALQTGRLLHAELVR